MATVHELPRNGALRAGNLLAPTAVRATDASDGFCDFDLTRAGTGEDYRTLAVLVRWGPRPLGWVDLAVPDSGLVTAAMVEDAWRTQLATERRGDGRVSDRSVGAPELVSVVLTTCADPLATERCVRAVLEAASRAFEIVVVDNRPRGSSVAAALGRAFGGDERVTYVEEPEPGLSRARNRGVASASGDVVAFIDDDVVVDEHWFDALRRGFAEHPHASCVTGLILPLDLETPAQILIQRMASFDKGFSTREYSIDRPPPGQPLFPYTAGFFGSGANMAFRREALLALGGFDPVLGAGSPALGGEDLDAYVRLLLSGRVLVYEPAAIVWHRHPHTSRRLSRQALHYGIGLGAMATKQLVTSPARWSLLRRAPSAVRYLVGSESRKNALKGPGYPARLEWLERVGVLLGPLSYARSRRHNARVGQVPRMLADQTGAAGEPGRTVWCGEFEISAPQLPERVLVASDGRPFDDARLLVRIGGEPAGFVHVALADGRISADAVWGAIQCRLGAQLEMHLTDQATAGPEPNASGSGAESMSLHEAAAIDVPVSAIVCTRDRPEELRGCLLTLQRLRHSRLEILVVDNAPADERTEQLVAELAGSDPRLRYVREPRPGLSCARNRGLEEARGEIIAFTDDDVRVDRLWLAGLLRGFRRAPDVGCVTGLVASASLEHPAERYFDGRVWWSSSCDQRLYRSARGPRDSRLHPYAAGTFGTGANLAFRAEAIRTMGGFDECLGVGSPTAGGEDLDAFVRLLRAGWALSYEPAALVWHEHRVDSQQLARQMHGYGRGLSAYLFKHLMSRRSGPSLIARLALVLRHALVLRRRSRTAADRTGVASDLAASEMRGLLVGPLAYIEARRRQSRAHLREVAP